MPPRFPLDAAPHNRKHTILEECARALGPRNQASVVNWEVGDRKLDMGDHLKWLPMAECLKNPLGTQGF